MKIISILLKNILPVLIVLTACFDAEAQNINRHNIRCPGGLQVNSYTGNLYTQRTDLFIPGRKFPFDFSFHYNSKDYQKNYGYGNGWTFNYSMKYIVDSLGVTIIHSDGRKDHFNEDTVNTGQYNAQAGIFDSLVEYLPSKFKLLTKEKMAFYFADSSHKRLTRMEEPNGNFLHFAYTDSTISEISDAAGRTIQLDYTAGYLTTITDALAAPTRTILYSYDYGNLKTVVDPAGKTTSYTYIVNGPMNTVTDKNENTVDIIYQQNFAVKEVISCNTHQRITYNSISKTTYLVETVEGKNQLTTFSYDGDGNLKKKTGNCCGFNTQYEYDNKKNNNKFTDANGNTWTYTYDSKGNVKTIRDPLGSVARYSYTPYYNKVSSYTDKKGNEYTFTYNPNGNLTQVVSPLGLTENFTYSGNGDLLTYQDPKGNTYTYTYDAFGNLTMVNRPLSANSTFTYDTRSRLLTSTDPLSHTFTFAYDALDRLTSLTDPLTHVTAFEYDANGNITEITDALNHATSFAYDAMDRMVTRTDALSHTTSVNYNAKNKPTSVTDANGNTTLFIYDDMNRLTAKTNAAGETTSYGYDGNGNVTSIGLPNGNIVTVNYTTLNLVKRVSDNIGVLFNRNFDANDNITDVSDANGNSTSYNYDHLDRLIRITDALGNTIHFTYDNNSNLLTYTDRNTNISSFTYDALNRRKIMTDALGNTTLFDYDFAGNLTLITDALNHTTGYAYDALNRNITQTFADATTNLYTYDAVGNLTTRTDNSSNITLYAYDNVNRLTGRNYIGPNDDAYTYDNAGRLLTAVNNNATVNFTYDAANRLLTETLNGKTTTYGYDVAGKLRTTVYPGGKALLRTLDERNRIVSINDTSDLLATFIYDAADRVISKSYPANGTNTAYSYDVNNRLTSLVTGPGNLLDFNYAYDNEGNKIYEKKNHKPDRSERYHYDNNYRLTEAEVGIMAGNNIPSPLHTFDYNYDALGNRTTAIEDTVTTTYTANSMNAYTSIAGATTVNPTYDANGNVTNDGTYTFGYNANNQLREVNSGAVATYVYDALGRRVNKTVGATTTNYYYNGFREIENRDGADNITGSFVYGLWIDDILSAEKADTNYFYYSNALGSVAAIANNTGSITERYDYNPFGEKHLYDGSYNTTASSASGNQTFFTGRTYDEEIKKYYYRFRTYNQETGRFQQHDPLQYVDGLNMYTYVKNNPENKIDPTGLIDPVTAGGLGAAAFGGPPAGLLAGECLAAGAAPLVVGGEAAIGLGGGTAVGAGVFSGPVGWFALAVAVIGVSAVAYLAVSEKNPYNPNEEYGGDMDPLVEDISDDPTEMDPKWAPPIPESQNSEFTNPIKYEEVPSGVQRIIDFISRYEKQNDPVPIADPERNTEPDMDYDWRDEPE